MNSVIEQMMSRAIELSKKALSDTLPNPRVGAIIFDDEGKILGQGYHRFYGSAHAEVEAINDANSKGSNIKGASICVTLEPCNHHGKTPPCTEALINSGIKKVYVGVADNCKTVCGCGSASLVQNGLEVKNGILEDECRQINPGFHKFNLSKLAFVSIKAAVSLNGKMGSSWFTGDKAKQKVHEMRSCSDLLVTGLGTIKKDNPKFNARINDKELPRNVLILDENVALFDRYLKKDLNVFVTKNKVIVASCDVEKNRILNEVGIQTINCVTDKNGKINLENLINIVSNEFNFREMMVEAGPTLTSAFLKLPSGYVDRLVLFVAPVMLNDKEPCFVVENDVYTGAVPIKTEFLEGTLMCEWRL